MKLEVPPRDDNRALTALSSASFALLLALVFTTPFVEMTNVLNLGQRSYRLYAYGLLGLLQIALIPVRGWKQSLCIFNAPVVFLLVWLCLSLTWTQHFDLSGKRLILLCLVFAGTFSGICDLGARRSLRILRILLVVALVLNFVTVLGIPDVGKQMFRGDILWRGFMAHKNIAGLFCALTIITFAFDTGKLPIAARWTIIAAALIFFVEAWSKTTLASLPIALASGAAIALIGSRHQALTGMARKSLVTGSRALFVIVILGLLILTLEGNFLLSLTENTDALTGRAAIWRPMTQFYLDHPMLGSGYGAYWDNSVGLIDPQMRSGAGMWKDVDQGHNGYLDLLVQIGLPGLALALYAAIIWPLAQLGAMIDQRPYRAALVFALLVFILIENFSESSLFADDTIGNAILLIALAHLHRFTMRSKGKRRSATSISRTKDGAPQISDEHHTADVSLSRRRR